MPGMANMLSTTSEPPSTFANIGTTILSTGMHEFRIAWRKIAFDRVNPLVLASSIYSEFNDSISSALI